METTEHHRPTNPNENQDPLQTKQDYFGDWCPEEKPPQHCRILLVTLFRLPIIKAADRSTQFLANLKDYNPDAVLMNDVGLHWKNIPMADSWAERTLTGFPPHKFRFSYNTHEDKQELVQWGGTGLLTLDQFRTRTYKQMGSDPHNLGRWTWA